MTRPGKPSKSEWVLLGITGVFLCLVLALFWQDRAAAGPGMTVQAQTQVPQEALTPDLSPIDLNTADVYDLQRLPGIGEVRAQAIVAYREEHGPFSSVDELDNVEGIGEGILSGLRDYASVGAADNES